MSGDISFFSRVLDGVYHTDIYKRVTEHGPLELPNSIADKVIDWSVAGAKKTTVVVLEKMKDKKVEEPDFREFVNHLHVPTARNWTRAVNGLLQGVAVLSLSMIVRRGVFINCFQNSLGCGAVGWGAVGIRHLVAAEYSPQQESYYYQNSRFVWKK